MTGRSLPQSISLPPFLLPLVSQTLPCSLLLSLPGSDSPALRLSSSLSRYLSSFLSPQEVMKSPSLPSLPSAHPPTRRPYRTPHPPLRSYASGPAPASDSDIEAGPLPSISQVPTDRGKHTWTGVHGHARGAQVQTHAYSCKCTHEHTHMGTHEHMRFAHAHTHLPTHA